MKAIRPPHVDRLVRRVQALDAPAVQLWAWPGSGQQAVLDALVAAGPRTAQPLSLEDLAEESSLRRAVEGAVAGAARWLVLPAVPAPPPTAARAIAGLLPAGRRLLFAAAERHPGEPLATAYIGPREHLLTEGEAATLWIAVTGRAPAPPLLAALMRATDGWYRPLLVLAEAAAAGAGLDDGALPALPGVESFLRHEVLAGLPAAARALVSKLALAGTADPEPWAGLLTPDEAAALQRLHEVWGLVVTQPGNGARLPAPLAALLAPAARRAQGAGALAASLAAAERRRGRPVAALELLVAAGVEGAAGLAELCAGDWPQLLVAAPLGLLHRGAALLPPRPAPGAELLRSLSAELLGTRPSGAAGGLERLAAEAEPAVAAAARLAASLLTGEGGGAGADPALPPALSPLAALAAVLAAAERGAEAASSGGAWDDAEPGAREETAPVIGLAAALAALPPPAAGEPDLLIERPAPSPPALPTVDRAGAASATPTVALPAGDRTGAAAAGADPRTSATSALATVALSRLILRRPALAAALRRRLEPAPAWRDFLAAVPAPMAGGARGYDLDLLGEARVRRRDGEQVRELSWPLKRALKALAYLATAERRRAGRDELEEALWPGADEDRVRRNFHPTLSHLRRSLEGGLEEPWEPPLLLEQGIYSLNPALAWRIDAAELERLLAAGRQSLERERVDSAVAIWECARDLYRGPFLAGWDDAWIGARRERYQKAWLDVLRALGETYVRLGRLGEAMDSLRAVLIHDPLQERVHLALMQIYARQGRRDLVRRQYDRLTELLSRELSVEPMDETTEAYHRLMA